MKLYIAGLSSHARSFRKSKSRKIDNEIRYRIQSVNIPYFNPDVERKLKRTNSGKSLYRDPNLALYCMRAAKFKCELNPKHMPFKGQISEGIRCGLGASRPIQSFMHKSAGT